METSGVSVPQKTLDGSLNGLLQLRDGAQHAPQRPWVAGSPTIQVRAGLYLGEVHVPSFRRTLASAVVTNAG